MGQKTIDIQAHPVFDPEFNLILVTPAIDEFLDTISSWYENGARGGMVWGVQLLGKSTAIDYCVEEFKGKYGKNFPAYQIPEDEENRTSKRAFFSHLLMHVGHTLHDKGTVSQMRTRLIEKLRDSARTARVNKVVLFIDEAQDLCDNRLNSLKSIMNNLKALYQIDLVVFLVGQPELRGIREALIRARKNQLVGRFLAREFEFYGLRNSDEIAYTLEAFDSPEIDFPEGSGISFTKFFFPEAYDFGWRLTNESEELWKVFEGLRDAHYLPVLKQIPMEYFFITIKYLLRNYSTKDPTFMGFSQEQITNAIKASGYVEGSRYYLPTDLD